MDYKDIAGKEGDGRIKKRESRALHLGGGGRKKNGNGAFEEKHTSLNILLGKKGWLASWK